MSSACGIGWGAAASPNCETKCIHTCFVCVCHVCVGMCLSSACLCEVHMHIWNATDTDTHTHHTYPWPYGGPTRSSWFASELHTHTHFKRIHVALRLYFLFCPHTNTRVNHRDTRNVVVARYCRIQQQQQECTVPLFHIQKNYHFDFDDSFQFRPSGYTLPGRGAYLGCAKVSAKRTRTSLGAVRGDFSRAKSGIRVEYSVENCCPNTSLLSCRRRRRLCDVMWNVMWCVCFSHEQRRRCDDGKKIEWRQCSAANRLVFNK